jgi:hypothetical protein
MVLLALCVMSGHTQTHKGVVEDMAKAQHP